MPQKSRQQYRHLPAFILLILAETPLHGNAVHGTLRERMGLERPDPGAVYRALQQMEQDGEVTFEWDTSASGPARKIYRLTDAGWTRLGEWEKDIRMRLVHLNHFLYVYDRLKK